MGLFPPPSMETWIACVRAAGNGPADRGAPDRDLWSQPHPHHVAVSSLWGPTWSPCFSIFTFSPVICTAGRSPFPEPSSDYVAALRCSEVISGPTSNQIKSSHPGGPSGHTPLWSQVLSPWNGAAVVKVSHGARVGFKPTYSFHGSWFLVLGLDFCSQDTSGTCPPGSQWLVLLPSAWRSRGCWDLPMPRAVLRSETPLRAVTASSRFVCSPGLRQ